MGMTIEDCTKMLIAKEKCMERETSGIDTNCNLHNCDDCSLCYEQGTIGEQKEALKFAVDTMNKYQQIQAIVNSKTTRLSYEEGFRQIKEVVEDGKNNIHH